MTTPPWTCWRDGQTYGPYDDTSLRSLAQTGRIRPTDLVSNGGAWVAAGAIPGLFPSSAGAPSPAPGGPQFAATPQAAPQQAPAMHAAPAQAAVAAFPLAPPHAPASSTVHPPSAIPPSGAGHVETMPPPPMPSQPAAPPMHPAAASPLAMPPSRPVQQGSPPSFAPVYASPALAGAPADGRRRGLGMPVTALPRAAVRRFTTRTERTDTTWSRVSDRMRPWLLIALLVLVVMWLWGVWNLPVVTIQP